MNVLFNGIQYVHNVMLYKFQNIFVIPKEDSTPMSSLSLLPLPWPQTTGNLLSTSVDLPVLGVLY